MMDTPTRPGSPATLEAHQIENNQRFALLPPYAIPLYDAEEDFKRRVAACLFACQGFTTGELLDRNTRLGLVPNTCSECETFIAVRDGICDLCIEEIGR